MAPSLKAYAAQLLSEYSSSMSATQKSAVERVSRTGKVPVSDYENAISGYRQCMLALGYKEIVFLEVGGGLKEEAMHRSGTAQQEEKYAQDSADCWFAHGAGIAHLYETQIGNPSLLSDPMEAIVDCLKRKKLVDVSYSAEQLKKERSEERSTTSGSTWVYSFKDSPESSTCLVSNGSVTADTSDPVEQLW
ncbi:hypothetical protein [Bifidobacterium leontopitheci]|uniref:hypothetical protein n=2 Tax=Bifidobacterium leontopitheci TaxID=2650774 RepID=UPI00126456DA|nr:hypothetical protein [Bifidobacterium leontopitheci]